MTTTTKKARKPATETALVVVPAASLIDQIVAPLRGYAAADAQHAKATAALESAEAIRRRQIGLFADVCKAQGVTLDRFARSNPKERRVAGDLRQPTLDGIAAAFFSAADLRTYQSTMPMTKMVKGKRVFTARHTVTDRLATFFDRALKAAAAFMEDERPSGEILAEKATRKPRVAKHKFETLEAHIGNAIKTLKADAKSDAPDLINHHAVEMMLGEALAKAKA